VLHIVVITLWTIYRVGDMAESFLYFNVLKRDVKLQLTNFNVHFAELWSAYDI